MDFWQTSTFLAVLLTVASPTRDIEEEESHEHHNKRDQRLRVPRAATGTKMRQILKEREKTISPEVAHNRMEENGRDVLKEYVVMNDDKDDSEREKPGQEPGERPRQEQTPQSGGNETLPPETRRPFPSVDPQTDSDCENKCIYKDGKCSQKEPCTENSPGECKVWACQEKCRRAKGLQCKLKGSVGTSPGDTDDTGAPTPANATSCRPTSRTDLTMLATATGVAVLGQP